MINKSLNISGRRLVYFILYFTLIMETLIAELNFPDSIRYLNDIAILMLLFFMKDKYIYILKKINCSLVYISILIFLIVSIITSIINFVPILLFIWGLRNTFRGIIFFLAIIVYINPEDLTKIFNILFKFQILNLILVLYQFFILNHEMDWVGGIFGYGNGAGVNIFNALLISYYLNSYLLKKEKLSRLVIVIGTSFIIAAIAEEKATYIFFVVIFIISIVMSKFSIKKVIAIISGILGITGGLALIKYYYPIMYDNLVNFDLMLKYAQTTYEVGYRIPRIGAFSFIGEKFFLNNKLKCLLGLGLGNCETSNFSFLQSDFYRQYGEWNYRWFTHQWVFLEEGYIGIISLVFIFISIIFCLWKYTRKLKIKEKEFLVTSICMGICCIITIWYNLTIKSDMSYLAYFSIAIGFVALKIRISNNKERR